MVSCGIADRDTHDSSFNTTEEKLIAAVADTIIPAGSSVGALSVGTDKFLQKLIDDCYDKAVGDNIKKQLAALDESAEKTFSSSFVKCSQQQRGQLLLKMSSSDNKEQRDFFTLMKTETIRGFNTSQKVMEEYFGYKVAPGHYYGCVPV